MGWGFDVDLGFLSQAAGRIGEAMTLAREMERRSGELGGCVSRLGAPALQEAASGFLERWEHGVLLVRDDTSKVGDALRASAEVYADVESGVVESIGDMVRGVDTVGDAVGDAAGTAGEAVGDAVDAAGDAVGGAVDSIRDVLG